jgi:anti-sigma regulatory factor (Ser/Thr protein kinase)
MRTAPGWPSLHLTLPATTSAPQSLRPALREWLADLGMPQEQSYDTVLAVNEAVSNVVDHAYHATADAGQVTIRARSGRPRNGRGQVRVTISDSGTWRPSCSEPSTRGHGLKMIKSCTDTAEIESTASGTQVCLISKAF